MLLNGCHNLPNIASLLISEAEILNDSDSLSGETQYKWLDLFSSLFLGQIRKVEVGFPLGFPRLEVSPSVEL